MVPIRRCYLCCLLGGLCGPGTTATGAILYFDVPDIVLTISEPTGQVTGGIDFLLDGSDEFLLTLTKMGLPTGDTVTTLTLGGTFPMASVFVRPDAGGPSIHQLTRFQSGDLLGTPANDVRRNEGRAFEMVTPSGSYTGDWGPEAVVGFAGLAIDGFAGPNFGWARMLVDHGIDQSTTSIVLYDFAFEGFPFTPIPAGAVPEPSADIPLILACMAFFGPTATPKKQLRSALREPLRLLDTIVNHV